MPTAVWIAIAIIAALAIGGAAAIFIWYRRDTAVRDDSERDR